MNKMMRLFEKKIVQYSLICIASVYLTFIVDVYTLNTFPKRLFVFGYFFVICTLFVYLKKRFLSGSRSFSIRLLSTTVAVLLVVALQNTFIPTVRDSMITLRAGGDGEVWMSALEVDGKAASLSNVQVAGNASWQYDADSDVYVYYPDENLEENYLQLNVSCHDICLYFEKNDWSGTVYIEVEGQPEEQLNLHTEGAAEAESEYRCLIGEDYSWIERVLLNAGIFIVLLFCLETILKILFEKTELRIILSEFVSGLEKYIEKWKWYHWAVFLLLNMIIAFQFKAQSLFMSVWQTTVTFEQIVFYLQAVVTNGILLLVIFSWTNTMTLKVKEKQADKDHMRKRKTTSIKWWMLCISLCVFVICSVLAYRVLPDFVSPSYVPTEITLTLLEENNQDSVGHEMILSKNAVIDGVPTALTPVDISGVWDTEHGSFWGFGPGSSITFSLPAAEDIDLRFNKHRWSGMVEIEDGAHKEKLDLYSDTSRDYVESYRVKSNIVPVLSKIETVLLSVLIGALFAGVACLLIYTTLTPASSKLYLLSLFLSAFSIWLLYLCAGNPGGMSVDTLNQFSQAKGEIAMTDAHPALLTMYYRCIFKLTDNPVVFSLIQMAFFAFIVAMFLSYLSLHGLSRKLLSVFAVLFSAHIVNGIYASILWKDIPYTVCLLWMTLLLTKLCIEKRDFFSVGNMIQLVICIPLAVLLRHNGIVVFILIGIVLLGFTVAYRSWKPALTLLLALSVFGGIKGPVYESFGVVPQDLRSTSGLVHGMAYTRIATEESNDFMDEIMSIDDWVDVYEPYSSNSFSYSEVAIQQNLKQKINDAGTNRIVQEYIQTFLRHPFLLIKDRLFGCNLLWNSIPNGYNWRITNDQYTVIVENNSFGYYCRENALTDIVNCIYQKSIRSTWSDMLIWRAGPYISISLILLFLSFTKKKYSFFLPSLPLLGNSISLLLSMAWQDYRYVYFAMVCTCFLTLAYFVCPQTESKNLSKK